jgi:FkbM family methyltransferase
MRVAIVILNWQEWEVTIQCLNALIKLDYNNFHIVIVDNGSKDCSCTMLEEWVIANQVNYNNESDASAEYITLISNPTNLGYAGGNNVGIRFALKELNAEAVWILNNDTSVEPDSLSYLISKLGKGYDVVGSQILFMDSPSKIWCECGGFYSRWSMSSQNISLGREKVFHEIDDTHEKDIESKLDYIAGASILFTSESLRKVGLLCEDYFLYFEEPDWFKRAEAFSIRPGYASKSIVYHSVGVSTDKFAQNSDKFYAFKKLQFRNTLLFTFKFYPFRLPIVMFFLAVREGSHSMKYFYNKMRKMLLRLIPKRLNLPLRYYKLKYKGKIDPELIWLKQYFKGGGEVALDVGANLGFYSFGLRSHFKTIHAFEPITKLSSFLEENNSINIVTHGIACSDSSGQANIYVPKLENITDYAYAGLDVNLRYKSHHAIEIQKETIDSFRFESVDLIKIDVEGHELNVVVGARQTIVRCKPLILAELENRHRDGAVSTFSNYLSELGYAGFYFANDQLQPISKFDPMRNQCTDVDNNPILPYINNFIFIHVSKLS